MGMKEYGIAFMLAGKLSSDFAKTFNAANKTLENCSDQIRALNKQASDVGNVVKLRQEAQLLAQKGAQQKKALDAMTVSIQRSSNPTKEQINLQKTLQSQYKHTKAALDRKVATLKVAEKTVGATGAKLTDLIAKEKKLATVAERATKAQAKLAKANENIKGVKNVLSDGFAGMTTTGTFAQSTLGAPVKAAMDFEDKMAEVRKVVDFDSTAEMNAMGKALQEMSMRIPITAAGLGDIMAAAGQSGIAKKDLIGFTEQAAKMSVAFDVSAEEAGTMMAKWKSGMKLTMEQTYALADATNALSNNDAALASEIGDVLKRVGALGGVMGIGEKQVAALGSAMIGAGTAPEIAATSIKKLGQALTKGENVTKRQAAAYEELGLNSEKVALDMQKDAEGTIMGVLKAIKKLPKEKQMSIMTNLFGDEGLQGIGPLLANLEAVQKNFNLVGDKANYAGSMQKEFASRSATASNALQLAKNAINVVAIGLGEALLPAIKIVAGGIVSIGAAVAQWIQNNQKLTTIMMYAAAGIFGVAGAFFAAKMAIGSILMPIFAVNSAIRTLRFLWVLFKVALDSGTIATKAAAVASYALKAAQLAAAGAMKVARLAMLGFNMVMAANPIALVVLAIAGLVAAGIALYKNWDTVKAKALELWAKVKSAFSTGIETIKSWLANFNLFESGQKIIQTLVNGIKSMASAPVQAVQGAFSKVRDMLPFSDAKVGPLSELTKSGQAIMSTIGSGIKKAGSVALTSPFEESAGGMFRLIDSLGKPASGAKTGGGSISVNFAPVINISGGGGDAYAQVKKGLAEGQSSLKKELERLLRDQQRLSYV